MHRVLIALALGLRLVAADGQPNDDSFAVDFEIEPLPKNVPIPQEYLDLRNANPQRELLVFHDGTLATSGMRDLTGPGSAPCVFERRGDVLTFSCSLTGADHRPYLKGIDLMPILMADHGRGNSSFAHASSGGGSSPAPCTITYVGTIAGDRIDGSARYVRNGIPTGEQRFSGKRVGPAREIPATRLWTYKLREVAGDATLECRGFTLVFPGVPYSGFASSNFTISGVSGTSGSSGFKGSPGHFYDSYRDGVCTFGFAGHVMTIADAGTKLTIDGQQFALDQPQPVIRVPHSGGSRVIGHRGRVKSALDGRSFLVDITLGDQQKAQDRLEFTEGRLELVTLQGNDYPVTVTARDGAVAFAARNADRIAVDAGASIDVAGTVTGTHVEGKGTITENGKEVATFTFSGDAEP